MINLLSLIEKHKSLIFLSADTSKFSYADLFTKISSISEPLAKIKIQNIWVLESENSYECYAKVLALLQTGHPFFLLPKYLFSNLKYRELLLKELQSSLIFCAIHEKLEDLPIPTSNNFVHNLLQNEILSKKSSFIVRTSGSSNGQHKFILHDASLFINKYKKVGSHFNTTFAFSPLESIAGIETLLECIVHGCKLVSTIGTYSPSKIIELLSTQKVDFFQTTPSFINLMLFSGEFKQQKITQLKKIAYGSEPSYKSTTQALKKEFTDVELMHTYGMSEIGILKTITDQAHADEFALNSVFNEGRIVNGYLEVQSLTPMIGYLNCNNEQSDIWFKTGDLAEINAHTGFIKVLGRHSDIINVAGQKFFPSELESLVMEMPEIKDVAVFKEKHPLVGDSITMKVNLQFGVDHADFRSSFKTFCETRLPRYMQPHRLTIIDQPLANDRFKKVRLE